VCSKLDMYVFINLRHEELNEFDLFMKDIINLYFLDNQIYA